MINTARLSSAARLLLIVCLTLWSTFAYSMKADVVTNEVSAIDGCTITGPTVGCINQALSFSRSCTNTNSWQWSVDGVAKGSGTSITHTFTQVGTFTVSLSYMLSNGTLVITNFFVTIYPQPSTPIIDALTATELCNSGSASFAVRSPQSSPVTYSWYNNGVYLGSGTSITATGITATTSISCYASLGSGCSSGTSSVTVTVITTGFTPQLDPSTALYHKRILRGTGSGNWVKHYWQTSTSGTSTSDNLEEDYEATELGTYYIRRKGEACWTTASSGIAITTMNYTPPYVNIEVKQKYGFNEIVLTNTDKAHILKYADFYWVTGPSSTTILGEYSINGVLKEWRKYSSGSYFLRGRDRDTGTWGATMQMVVSLLTDNSVNSIHSKTFDGGSAPQVVAESKSYFDDAGKPLQSQIKNLEKGYVFATQSIRDKYDRVVGSTLPAPIGTPNFLYNQEFLLNENNTDYSPADFDDLTTKYNPNKVSDNTKGTIGWYYSDNNTLEPNVGKTDYPYSRTEFYDDGSGDVKRSASPGDQHRLGKNHEILMGTFPVWNELDDYLSKRLTAISGITQDGSLRGNAIQQVSFDQNGKCAVSISDDKGNLLMSALAGSSDTTKHILEVNNSITETVTLGDPYKMIYFYILEDQPVQIVVPGNTPTSYYQYSITDDSYDPAKNRYVAATEIRLLPGFEVTGGQTFSAEVIPIGGGWSAENLITGEKHSVFNSFEDENGNWPAGFYRISVQGGQATVSYANHYQDVSYNFYDDANRIKSSVSPNGYKAWKKGTAYSLLDKTTYTNNFRGWLLSLTEPDAGTTTYKYRQDGRIRFSQNAKQAAMPQARFSYTNYDKIGRPIQSGEYKGTTYSFASLTSQLEQNQQVTYPDNDIVDWMKTYYDEASIALPTDLPTSFKQTNLATNVAYTENENNKTWYSYDELGRVVWIAQKPKALTRTFVTTYQYDFLGNILKTGTISYIAQQVQEQFYHHYAYDKDKRLAKAYTSTDGETKTLRAEYDYYMHGPLKRIELGNGVQGIDFVYNIHGWLTQINHPSLDSGNDPGGDGTNGVRSDVFGMSLDYYESEMEDLFPTAAVIPNAINPEQFHGLPINRVKSDLPVKTEIAGRTPKLVMPATKEQWRFQAKQVKDYILSQKQNKKDSAQFAYLIPVQQDEAVSPQLIVTSDFTIDEETLVASASNHVVPSSMLVGSVDDAIELAVLKQIYDSLGGANWTYKSGWPTAGNWPSTATAAQMDAWYGIHVVNGDIVGIALVANSCTGKIPSVISQLTELQSLQLNSNGISGKIPASLGSMTKLRTLYLHYNSMSGGIPSALGSMTAMIDMRLNVNPLGGSIPSSLGSLTSMTYLDLSSCGLTGSIPASFKKLASLSNLNLSSNTSMSGTLPPLGKLSNLQTLNLSGLTGLTPAAIPTWLDSLRNLVTLNLDNSKRNGSIPAILGNLTNLQTLSLNTNQLTGSIPSEITQMTNLRSLLLTSNQLSGSIPVNIGNLQLLTTLWLSTNQISGTLPLSLYSLSQLSDLKLNSNALTGTISENLGNLTSLVILDLSNNRLFGEIPSEIGNLSKLTYLHLAVNQLTGSVPASIRNLNKLYVFSVYTNSLSGEIPPLETLTLMEYFYLGNNRFTGSIGSWVGAMTKLRYFRIEENEFTAVDASVLNSTQLTQFYATGNKLTSVPNFYAYPGKAALSLMLAYNYLDFGDLETLFGTPGIGYSIYAPQKKFDVGTKVHVQAGATLTINAQPKGSYSTVTWEKQNGTSWTSVNSLNEDVTQQTFKISNATTSLNGYYRWRMTNTRVTGLGLQSVPIEVQVVDQALAQLGNRALYNGTIASARWQTQAPELDQSSDNLSGMYVYDYDDKYQIKDASFAQPNYLIPGSFEMQDNQYRVTNLAYDPNGNIQSLTRYDKDGVRTNNFAYTYTANKNQLSSVSGHVSNYTYNAIGQMTDEDKEKGEDQYVEYDVSGKVVSVFRKGVSPQGLLGDYPFSANFQNSASVMGDGSMLNAAYFVADRNGQAYSAGYSDGVNMYMSIDDPAEATDFREHDFTISYWVKRVTSVAGKYSGVTKWSPLAVAGSSEWALNTGNASGFNAAFSIEIGVTPYSVVGTTTLQTGQWYHLTGVRENGYIKVYVNGQLENSTYVGNGAINSTTVPIYVSTMLTGPVYTNSAFDEIKFYNRALNAGEIQQVMNNLSNNVIKARYKYDDHGFRLAKTVYPNATTTAIGTDVRTTWYIRDASGNVMSTYEQDGEPATNNTNPLTQTEVPIYGAGKLGMYYPAQDGSVNYEITDHLGNVRALVRDNVNIYTATMEDDGTADLTNPRVEEMQYFQNLFDTEMEDSRFNHTPGGEYSAYLYWIGGSGNQHKAVGPAITLKVNAGDTLKAETWVRFEKKSTYARNVNIAAIAGLLSGSFSFTSGFENITMPQTTTAFNNALTSAGFMGDNSENELPFAYLNYVVFDENRVMVDAGWKRVDESMGFDPGQEALTFHQHKKLAFDSVIKVTQNGYIYIWVSNESEGTKVWFDDVKVTHTQVVVTQSTDYGVWGDVLRELKAPEFTYRYGYQGQFAEKDQETGWNHFELREYDPVIGRWTSKDPAGQYYSPYVGMGNNPVNGTDPDGSWVKGAGLWNNLFKSDARIWAEQYASTWSSDNVDYFASKSGDAWGVYAVDKVWVDNGRQRYSTFTSVNSDGLLGATDGEFESWMPAPGNLEFDPMTQLTLGFAVAAVPTATLRAGSLANSLYWRAGATYNYSNLVLTQAARNIAYSTAMYSRPLLLSPTYGTLAWRIGSATFINLIHYSRKGNVDVGKLTNSFYGMYKRFDKVIDF